MRHANLQHGLYANFNGKHFVGGIGRSKENKNHHETSFIRKNIFSK